MQTRTTTSRIAKVITLSLSTLMGALLHVQAAQTAVYLKAGATGQADGTSWADAYTDAASAIAAAATAGLPIYAAGGVYIISATITPSASIAIYGGFAGLSDDETPDDRDTDLYQTIFTGDKTLDDKWVHVEPRLGQYGVTSTTLTNTVIQNGRVVLPPAFTADYDVYYGTISGNNTSQGFSISSGVAVTFDGLWFTGFTSSGSVGSVLTLDSGAGAFVMNDCRLTACSGGTRAAIFLGNSAAARITNSRFFCTTSVEGGAFRSGNANLIVSNCLFTSFYRSGQNTSGNVFYAQTDNELRDCEFSRCFDITSQAGGAWGGMGNLNGGDGGNPRFINCVITNNLSITSGQYGNPLIPRATLIKGCLFANNRYETKPFDGRGYALVGYAYASVSWHMLCEGCVFRDNVVTAPASTTTAGAYYLGILGQNVVGNGSGQSFGVVNCVFDSNVASATHAPLTGVAPHLCRGTYVLGTITGSKPQIGVANCTFTGSLLDGVYDIAQWGENYAQDITVVNSTFSVNDAEIASNWLYADVPGRVKAYSCSVKNLPAVPENFAVCANLETDDIPLDADYRPLARTPGIRTTAEVSTNVASAAASTFAYLPNGAEIWVALLPVVSATITSTNSPIGDLFGATRPYGAFTRGAVQRLNATAETGVTLTLRRSPLASGTLTGAANAQSVAIGAATTPVTAVPANASVEFDGWFRTDDSLYTTSNPLTIASLTTDLTLIAKFKAATVLLTFNLGVFGTFDANGLSTITVEAEYLNDFPAIPAYTLNEGWFEVGWQTPPQVPAADTSYALRCVSKDVRIIHVIPEEEAEEGVERDGTSWARAYTNIIEAIADAGIYRGEVWLKTGVYKIRSTVSLMSNVAIRGGFAGNETDAAAADPAPHPVILTGDLNGDDYWLVNGSSPAVADRTPIFEGVTYNPPNPDGTDNYWFSGGNASENTSMGLVYPDSSVTNSRVSGITLALFANACFATSPGGADVYFEKCRFLGGNASRTGNDAASQIYDTGAVNINGTTVEFDDCIFEGSYWALRVAGSSPITNFFRRCQFNSNAGAAKACAVRLMGSASAIMEECRFYRNCSVSEMHESAACLVLASGDSRFTDCIFEDNRCRGDAHGMITAYGGSATFERCSFTGNTMNQHDSYSRGALVFCGYADKGTFLVRDCYFGGNQIVATSPSFAMGGILSTSGKTQWTFLNCTIEDNEFTVATTSGLFQSFESALALVNCAVRETAFSCATGTLADVRWTATAGTLSILNSAFANTAEDYVPLLINTNHSPCLANSVMAGYTPPAATGSNGFIYDVVAAQPLFVEALQRDAAGLPARRLASSSPGPYGRKVWLKGGDIYFHDDIANAAKPWRKVIDKGFFAASVEGLDITSPCIPDAFGTPRSKSRVALGPLNVSWGMMMLVR